VDGVIFELRNGGGGEGNQRGMGFEERAQRNFATARLAEKEAWPA